MSIYNDYVQKSLKDKVFFWDVIFIQETENHNTKDMFDFLKSVSLNNNEPLFCRMRALKEIIIYTYLGKIKQRKIISFLLDELIDSNEALLECYRLKYLSLFYQKEKDEIKDALIQKCSETNEHVKAEANYQLGLLMFFDANDLLKKSDYINSLFKAQQLFNEATRCEENRVDAELLRLTCSYIISCLNYDMTASNVFYQKIKELIFEVMLFRFDDEISLIYLSIGQSILKVQDIISKSPENWINYKNKFNELCLDFYTLTNNFYKRDDLYKTMLERMNKQLKKEIVEPMFKYNYKATQSKIDVLLSENDLDEQTESFLKYLKKILVSEDMVETNPYREYFKENFPMLTQDELNSLISSSDHSDVSIKIYNLLNAMQRLSPKKVLKDIVSACIKLQANSLYKDRLEDERNDYIRDILSTQKYEIRDQTRQGTSQKGKASGEIDILIFENNIPYCLIEALNMNSLNKGYLNEHIDKIFNYDTLGYKCNFLISYVNVKDFEGFYKKYLEYIHKYKYPYPLVNVDENIDNNFGFSNIRVTSTTLNRNGKETTLYHICVLMQ